MQYILDEYEYNELQRASSEQNDLLQEEVWNLQEDIARKDREIARLVAQLAKYRNKFGLLEPESDWEKSKKARCSGGFNF